MKQVILINGPMRSGKDFLGSLLYHEFTRTGLEPEIVSFANPLKQIIANTFYISLQQLDDYKNDEDMYVVTKTPMDDTVLEASTYREILQRFGTEGMKPIFGNDVWGKLMFNSIEKSKTNVIIITDFRFDEEYNCLSSLLTASKQSYILDTIYVQGKDDNTSGSHSSEQKPNIVFNHTVDNSKQDNTALNFAKQYARNNS